MPTSFPFQDSGMAPGVQLDPDSIDGLTGRSCIQRLAAQGERPPTQNVQAPIDAMLTPARSASHPATSNATLSRSPRRTPNHRSSEPAIAKVTSVAAQILRDRPVAARTEGRGRQGGSTRVRHAP